MTYYGPIAAEATYLSSLLPGLSPVTAQAWLMNEGQSDSIATPSNPLNIVVAGGGSGSGLETGTNGPLYTYTSWQDGLQAVAHLLKSNPAYSGILAAIATGDPIAQAKAIEASPWAGGNYGATKTSTGKVTASTRTLLGMSGAVDSGAAVAQSTTPTTPAPLKAAPLTSGLTGSSLLSEIQSLDAVPNLSSAQSKQLASDMNALIGQLGGGSAAADAASSLVAWQGAPLPIASPALVRASVASMAGAPVQTGTQAPAGSSPVTLGAPGTTVTPSPGPVASTPTGVSPLLLLALAAIAVLVFVAAEE